MNRPLAFICAVTILGMSSPRSTFAADECNELRGDEQTLPGEFLGKEWKHRTLPSKGDVDDALTRLDYDDEKPLVYSIDLNRDGKPELLLTSPGGRLCGNAGCPYVLLDPKTFKRIGEFFGHLAILNERVNGYRIIQSFSRSRVAATSLDTYVFDRGAYRLVSHAIIDACGLQQWQRRMRISSRQGIGMAVTAAQAKFGPTNSVTLVQWPVWRRAPVEWL